MWQAEVFGTRAFRLALAFALAVSAATIGAFVLIYFAVANENATRVGAILSQEVRINADATEDRLRSALEVRQTPDIRRIDYLSLFGPAGDRIFGNLIHRPAMAADGEPHLMDGKVMADIGALEEPAILVAAKRRDGGEIVMGRALKETREIERSLGKALKLALAPTVLAILLIGLLFASRTIRRLDGLRAAMGRIMEGRLDLRLPVTGERDEIDQVARAANLMLNEIARLLDQLRQVGDNIAHDLRSPLASARVMLERAQDMPAEAASAQIAAAMRQLDRANAAIGALLRVSSVERENRRERFADLDLSAICMQMMEFFEPLAASRSIRLTAEAPAPVAFRGDEDLLREALANLIENALKFTPAGGSVSVRALSGPNGPRLEVADSGPGVPVAERQKIFRRFYSAPLQSEEPGHGLGLSIVRSVADLHGLEIIVEDNDPGARFVLRGPTQPGAVT